MDRDEYLQLFTDGDKLKILNGLIIESYDCKEEIDDLKKVISICQRRGVPFSDIAERERVLNQKRASYTAMMGKLAREFCKETVDDDLSGLEDFE